MWAVLVPTLVVVCLAPAATRFQFFSNWVRSYQPISDNSHAGSNCQNAVQTTTIYNVQTKEVVQPVTVQRGPTFVARALVTQVVAVTTTMVQTETRQVQIPITHTYEHTNEVVQTSIIEEVVQLDPVVEQVTHTTVVTTTHLIEVVNTSYNKVMQPIRVYTTLVTTILITATETDIQMEVQLETIVVRAKPLVSITTNISRVVRTEVTQQPNMTSVVDTVLIQTQELTSLVTPTPVVNTQVVSHTLTERLVKQVLETLQVVMPQVRTEVIQVTDSIINYVTSTFIIDEVVIQTITQLVDRHIVETQLVEEVVTCKQVVEKVEQRLVTTTTYDQVTDYQTMTSAVDVHKVVSAVQDLVQVTTQMVNIVIQQTPNKVVTAKCTQTHTDYNYSQPTYPFTFE